MIHPAAVRIESLADPRVQVFRHLKQTNLTRWSGRFIAEGEKLVERLLASNHGVESVLAVESMAPAMGPKIPPQIPLFIVPDALGDALVGFNFHQGVLACGRRPVPLRLDEALRAASPRFTMVVCLDVQGPENLGAILRISSAFGVEVVALGPRCCDPFSRRVLRVSMGEAFRLKLVELTDVVGELTRLKAEQHVELVATVLDPDAEPLDRATRPARLALLFGSEGHGLTPEHQAMCDRRVTIPMRLGTDSLNVAVAAGVFLFHFTRD